MQIGDSAQVSDVPQTPTGSPAQPTDEPPDERPGRVLAGRYRLESVIGRGASATVYEATQLAVGRRVALKLATPSARTGPEIHARFEREARAVAGLVHPNTIRLHDFGVMDDGRRFLVTELLEGVPLSTMLERQAPLAPARALHILWQILEALAEAHDARMVHRDIKPQNIFVAEVPGRTDFIKVLDFGIAAFLEATGEATLTRPGVALGSPRYMSPEQALGESTTPASDVYSTGLVLYEMLAGASPYACDTARDYLEAHATRQAPIPERDQVPLEGPLVDVLMAMLRKVPEDRPATARDALRRLARLRQAPDSELARPRGERLPTDEHLDTLSTQAMGAVERVAEPPAGRRVWLWAGVAAALVAVAVLLLVLPGGQSPVSPQPLQLPHLIPAPAAAQVTIDRPAPAPVRPALVADVAPAEPTAAEPTHDVGAPPPEVRLDEPAQRTVSVSFSTHPAGATLFLDGELKGQTNLMVELPLKDEPWSVELRSAGYKPVAMRTTFTEDRLVEQILERVAEPEPTDDKQGKNGRWTGKGKGDGKAKPGTTSLKPDTKDPDVERLLR